MEGCQDYAPGIESNLFLTSSSIFNPIVISVRVTKPQLPQSIMKNFIDLEVQRGNLKLQKIKNEINILKDDTQREIQKLQAGAKNKILELEMETLKLNQAFEEKNGDIQIKIQESNNQVQIDLIKQEALLKKEISALKMDEKYLKFAEFQKYRNIKKVRSLQIALLYQA